jgi:AcrR family transcriptional regulator
MKKCATHKDHSTEDKIKEAARTVFLSKGFAGCSSREIAKAAGMNVALVNYYFRSKQKLFALIFSAAMEDFMRSMIDVFQQDLQLEEKLRIYIEKEFDFLAQHPELANFIINEIQRTDSSVIDHVEQFEKVRASGIFAEFEAAKQRGEVRNIDIFTLTLLILSNCHYPFMAKNFMQELQGIDEHHYAEVVSNHKQVVTEMLINYLFNRS